MALKLITNFEESIWREWSERFRVFSDYYVRRMFYPNKMEDLKEIMNKFSTQQRDSTKYLISKRKDFPECWSKLSDEERNKWRENTARIKSYSADFKSYIKNNKVDEFLSEIDVLEKQRICDMLISYIDRERDNTIKEAAENLIYFANKVNEEYNTKQKKKTLRQVKIARKVEPVLRRSSRLAEKTNARR